MATPKLLILIFVNVCFVLHLAPAVSNLRIQPSICKLSKDGKIPYTVSEERELSLLAAEVTDDRSLIVRIVGTATKSAGIQLLVRPLSERSHPTARWKSATDSVQVSTCNSMNDTLRFRYPPSNNSTTNFVLDLKSTPEEHPIEIFALVSRESRYSFAMSTLKWNYTKTKKRSRKARAVQCGPNICLNNGVCITSTNTCDCGTGFTGQNCQYIDHCSSRPCQNGGSCSQFGNSYICTCKDGFDGTYCEIELVHVISCLDEPCQNGGTCYQSEDSALGYVCTCGSEFMGINCQIAVDSCASNPCVYGTCKNSAEGFLCGCWSGWTGPRCLTADIVTEAVTDGGDDRNNQLQTTPTPANSYPNPRRSSGVDLNIGVIVGIVVAMILGVAIGISVTLFIYCFRRRHLDDDVYVDPGLEVSRDGPSDRRRDPPPEGSGFPMRSYESMSSIDDVLPDHTPAVVLTGEHHYEVVEVPASSTDLTQQNLRLHDERVRTDRGNERTGNGAEADRSNVRLNITRTDDINLNLDDNASKSSGHSNTYNNIEQPD
ncbi:delta-like protein A [Ptychodera flava]|uniref:delta-like protein A n=1 Tax=Ptychodera flava TaxID=63121 RepID=UPI00396A7AD5